ncbi:MAG: hypothetical protein QXW19_06170 [Candidatus Bathyarchaeia archaeon]
MDQRRRAKSAIVIGDVHEAYGGGPSEVCPRGYVARNAMKAAEGMGYTGYFTPEVEYFLLSSIDPTIPIRACGFQALIGILRSSSNREADIAF